MENGGGGLPSRSERPQRQQQEEVRAPIAAKTDILAGGGPAFHPSLMHSQREHSNYIQL